MDEILTADLRYRLSQIHDWAFSGGRLILI